MRVWHPLPACASRLECWQNGKHRRITCVLPAPTAGNCVRTASKKLSVKNFLSHDYWPMLSAYSGSNWVWADRRRYCRPWYCFYSRLFTQKSGSIFPKESGIFYTLQSQRSASHPLQVPIAIVAFSFQIPKTRGLISMYILHFMSPYNFQ